MKKRYEKDEEMFEKMRLDEYVEYEGNDLRKLSRRKFLRNAMYAVAGAGSFIALEPVPYKRGTAFAEKKIPPEYWAIASRYGQPQGKFGAPGSPAKITIGYQPYCLQCQTANINKTAELWKKHLPPGSKVEWFRALSGPLINNNMLAGKNMFGYFCDNPALRAMDTVPVVTGGSGGYDTGEHGAVVVRKDLWDSGKVKSIKDLSGAKVATGIGTFSNRHALDVIRQFGLKIKLLDQSSEVMVTHLRAKNIDAAVIWEPYPTYLEYLGIGYRIITGLEMECTCIAYRPQNKWHNWTTSCMTLMVRDWLRDRPDIMVGYLKAEEEARDMWVNNLDLASYYVWKDIPEFPQPVVRMIMEMNVPDSRIDDKNWQDHLKGIAIQWRELGMLDTPKSADAEKFIDENVDVRFMRLGFKEIKEQGLWTSEKLPGFHSKLFEAQGRKHNLKDFMNVKLQPKDWKPTQVKWA